MKVPRTFSARLSYIAKGVFLGCHNRHVRADDQFCLHLSPKAIGYCDSLNRLRSVEAPTGMLCGRLKVGASRRLPGHQKDAPADSDPSSISGQVLALGKVTRILDDALDAADLAQRGKILSRCNDRNGRGGLACLEPVLAQQPHKYSVGYQDVIDDLSSCRKLLCHRSENAILVYLRR